MIAEADTERRGTGPIEVIRWADDVDRSNEAVELVAADSAGEIVVEHTRIESYDGQIADLPALYDMFPLGGVMLPEHRPQAGLYRIGVPLNAFRRVERRRRELVAGVLTSWVRDHISAVPWPHRPGDQTYLTGEDPAVPFRWTLERHLPDRVRLVGPLGAVVPFSFGRPADLEDRRQTRLGRALAKKLPKLHAAAGGSRRSILVVEDRDVVLSSPRHASVALEVTSMGMTLPDAVCMLHTGMGNPLWCDLWDGHDWTHRTDNAFPWKEFPVNRAGQLNALGTGETWHERRSR